MRKRVEGSQDTHRPLAEIGGRHYRPKGGGTYITKAPADSPPAEYHVSTPDPDDATGAVRIFWLFLGIGAAIGFVILELL